MKITIQKSIIENILIHAGPFLEKKDTSQITSHVYFNVSQNTLTIKATDYEIGFLVQIQEINIFQEGSITANGKKLLDIIKILKNDIITLEQINNYLHITQAQSKFKLPTFAHNEFPKFPTHDTSSKISINSHILIESLKKITPTIDNNNPKFELNGALMDIQNNSINFASTDTKRLAIMNITNENIKELSIIIPKKAIIEIQKLFFDEIEIFYDETNLIITSQQYTFFTKLINGKFPEYQRIIPKETKYKIMLPKQLMIESFKQITTISNDIKLTFFQDNITFEALSDDNIEAKTQINFNTPFEEPFELAVNSRFILDFLNVIDNKEFLIELNEGNLPFMLSDNNFKTIIMPIIL